MKNLMNKTKNQCNSKPIFTGIFVLVFLWIGTATAQNVWRVSNVDGANVPGVNVDFTSIQEANDDVDVLAGDTLYVMGSALGYGNCNFNKKLVIIGPGYLLLNNDATQANKKVANFSWLTFQSGSEGSIIMGTQTSIISAKVDNIQILGNRILTTIYISGNNTMIRGNYSSSNYAIENNGNNTILTNNIIKSLNVAIHMPSLSYINFIISHNVISGQCTVYNATVTHNILESGTWTTNPQAENDQTFNMCNENQFDNQLAGNNGNINNKDMGTVFQGGDSPDAYYQLEDPGPAKGAGDGGVDLGVFSGATPYLLSGIPPIPSIYQIVLTSPSNGNVDMKVNIDTKSNQ